MTVKTVNTKVEVFSSDNSSKDSAQEDEHEIDVISLAKQIYRTKGKKEGWIAEFIDKTTYVSGAVSICFITFSITSPAGRPWLPIYHIILYPILCVIRYYQYRRTKSHYFLMDFCYWFNLAVTWYLFAPGSAEAFAIIFSLSNGTLPWTILMYQNALVFHSVDKLTSCYIHMVPMYIVYIIRWYPSDTANILKGVLGESYKFNMLLPGSDLDANPTVDYVEQCIYLILWATMGYAVQQVLYGFILNVVAAKLTCCFAIYKDKEMKTLYRYTMRNKQTLISRIASRFPRNLRVWLWFFSSVLFTVLTALPTIVFYNYKQANEFWMVLVSVFALWNGARFYLEVFSLRWLEHNVTRFTSNQHRGSIVIKTVRDDSQGGPKRKSVSVVPMNDEGKKD